VIRRIAKLGEGKWHRVLWYSENLGLYRTACHKDLEPYTSSMHTVSIKVKDGVPTCKFCLRTEK